MLESTQKQAIQQAYSQYLEYRQLKPRRGQKLMIAEIARLLGDIQVNGEGQRCSDPAVAVIEAGTGTGKTVAYLLPAIVMAAEAKKTLVLSTATVTLQEQIVFRDLPDVLKNSGLSFSFQLAKGRGRYACISKLDRVLSAELETDSLMDMFAGQEASVSGMGKKSAGQERASRKLYQAMLEDFASSKWAGDRDSWSDVIDEEYWRMITTDHAQCTNRRCSYFHQCPFFKARACLDEADVIVVNHDIVMADLALGGGAILPDIKECLYVFDEGHHLPDKAIGHFACHSRIRGSISWLEKTDSYLKKKLRPVMQKSEMMDSVAALQLVLQELVAGYQQVRQLLEPVLAGQENIRNPRFISYRFQEGKIPEAIRHQACVLKGLLSNAIRIVDKISKTLNEAMDGKDSVLSSEIAQQLYPNIGAMALRLDKQQQLWSCYEKNSVDDGHEPPDARWIQWNESESGEEMEVFSSPVLPAGLLQDKLWQHCYSAVVTSATLASMDDFHSYRLRAGLPENTRYAIVPGAFRYHDVATLHIPVMSADPGNAESHTDNIVELLPSLLNSGTGILVLFASRRQMQQVYDGLTSSVQQTILLQDDYSRQELLKRHKERVDNQDHSVLFGLSSLSEGIDLPGNYCDHVIIAKIPFAVPDDPVNSALGEWLVSRGHNPFMEIAVPDAALRLIQACGRLLRTETDTGRVTLLDRRIVTKRYGQKMLDSLPSFCREIGYSVSQSNR
ncbi:putative ATP-dependent helicase DinG [invertebrate metagenome]|uniref:Putative ATP-dependent helicase DinG n=1 Tax=invertebrate metagenome TaxID=1711999 RepID=A0A2H9T4T8_9ZZZZ